MSEKNLNERTQLLLCARLVGGHDREKQTPNDTESTSFLTLQKKIINLDNVMLIYLKLGENYQDACLITDVR